MGRSLGVDERWFPFGQDGYRTSYNLTLKLNRSELLAFRALLAKSIRNRVSAASATSIEVMPSTIIAMR